MKYILILILFLGCTQKKDSSTSSIIQKTHSEQKIYVYGNYDTMDNVSIKNWQGTLPDSLHLKPIFSIFISDSSDIVIERNILKNIRYVEIEESRLGSDTLLINNVFNKLDYLYLTNLNCVIANDDTISIKNLNYASNQKNKHCFRLDLSKVKNMDTLYIYAPYENITIPTDKDYKYVGFRTLNDQIDTLKKYYKYASLLPLAH